MQRTLMWVAAGALCLVPLAIDAQRLPDSSRAVAPDTPGAFVLESLGGSLGSAVGIVAVTQLSRCPVDDLGCGILTAAAAGLAGVAGATLGASVAATYTGSQRSTLGAAVGGLAGTAVGLGVHWLLNRNSDRNVDDAVVVPIFALSQGVFAALGSRLVGAAMGMR